MSKKYDDLFEWMNDTDDSFDEFKTRIDMAEENRKDVEKLTKKRKIALILNDKKKSNELKEEIDHYSFWRHI